MSYARRHNEANGHGNQDGQAENFSWNWGVEGDAGVSPGILALRRQLVKNFCCILLLSNGTPMFCAGDEFMHTQRGNSNPYNQDNETTWLDWDRLGTNADVFRFFRLMIAFRRAHPSIGRGRFWGNDVRWYGVDGPVEPANIEHRLAFLLDGSAERDVDLYVMINAFWEDQRFAIQGGSRGSWVRVIDTGKRSPDDFLEGPRGERVVSGEYVLGARSVIVVTRAAADPEAVRKT